MDLIYTDTMGNDVGVLKDYTLDLAFGSDENDFELTVDLKHHCCEVGCLVYIENTEYGGIIDGWIVSTVDEKLTYVGRTWHGILAMKIIEPDPGESYMKVSGEANEVIGGLINRLGLSDLFVTPTEQSGLFIDNYSFDRYIDAYSGIKKMLELISAKVKFTFAEGKVIISAVPSVDYSQDEQFDNESVEMQIENRDNTVNHLICLGKGELKDRTVVHLYVDANGNVSDVQTIFGSQEQVSVLDYPSVESEEELVNNGVNKLKELRNARVVEMDFTADEDTYDVGDTIGAEEIITGTIAVEKITKKIVTINKGEVNIQYKVGE